MLPLFLIHLDDLPDFYLSLFGISFYVYGLSLAQLGLLSFFRIKL